MRQPIEDEYPEDFCVYIANHSGHQQYWRDMTNKKLPKESWPCWSLDGQGQGGFYGIKHGKAVRSRYSWNDKAGDARYSSIEDYKSGIIKRPFKPEKKRIKRKIPNFSFHVPEKDIFELYVGDCMKYGVPYGKRWDKDTPWVGIFNGDVSRHTRKFGKSMDLFCELDKFLKEHSPNVTPVPIFPEIGYIEQVNVELLRYLDDTRTAYPYDADMKRYIGVAWDANKYWLISCSSAQPHYKLGGDIKRAIKAHWKKVNLQNMGVDTSVNTSVASHPDLSELPETGSCRPKTKVALDRLYNYLKKKYQSPGGKSTLGNSRTVGYAWTHDTFWAISMKSSNKEYKYFQLDKLINNPFKSNNNGTDKSSKSKNVCTTSSRKGRYQGNGLHFPKRRKQITVSSGFVGNSTRLVKRKTKSLKANVQGRSLRSKNNGDAG